MKDLFEVCHSKAKAVLKFGPLYSIEKAEKRINVKAYCQLLGIRLMKRRSFCHLNECHTIQLDNCACQLNKSVIHLTFGVCLPLSYI